MDRFGAILGGRDKKTLTNQSWRQKRLGEQSAPCRRQWTLGQRLRVGAVNAEVACEGVVKPLNELRAHFIDDEHNPGPMVGVRPGVETRRRMEDMLNPVDDQRPRRIVGQGDDSLDPEQIWPVGVAQDLQEQVTG